MGIVAEWRCAIAMNGAPFVHRNGTEMMPWLFVDSLVLVQIHVC